MSKTVKIVSLKDASSEVTNRWLWDQCKDAADDWNRQQNRDVWASLYLWYRRGALAVAPEKPIGEGWELAIGERIPVSQTAEQCKFWIYNRSTRLCVLPEEFVI